MLANSPAIISPGPGNGTPRVRSSARGASTRLRPSGHLRGAEVAIPSIERAFGHAHPAYSFTQSLSAVDFAEGGAGLGVVGLEAEGLFEFGFPRGCFSGL